MTDLASWLLEQIADDEHVAGDAKGGPRDSLLWATLDGDGIVVDPGRVLADCKAKRAVVESIRDAAPGLERIIYGAPASLASLGALAQQVRVEREWYVKQLALPYADRPGYRREWRP